ncbi:high mobility group nucleosome-binding domain-containing protein 5-like [Penaeus vannamei]|uniref:high mobility group nucleosome-binding domain-containing protein 5-like n=1 Tax=Penaeus vannamei TaxID=6689 RepID=UPI00387F707A
MKTQRRLPKSMRKNPVVHAMPRWTSDPESTEWFDSFNLAGQELIAFVAEPRQSKEGKKEDKRRQEKRASKTDKMEEKPKPTKELKAHAKKDGHIEQVQKRQQKAEENRAQHLKLVLEQMRKTFVAKTGEPLIGEPLVAGRGNRKAALVKLLPQQLAKIATSTNTSQSGKSGLWELVQEELRRERERLGLKPKRYVPGMQLGNPSRLASTSRLANPSKLPNPNRLASQSGKPQQIGKHQQSGKPQQIGKHQQSGKPQQIGKHQQSGKPQQIGKHQQVGKPQQISKHQQVGNPQQIGKQQQNSKPQQVGKPQQNSKHQQISKHQQVGKPQQISKHQQSGKPQQIGKYQQVGKPQ